MDLDQKMKEVTRLLFLVADSHNLLELAAHIQ